MDDKRVKKFGLMVDGSIDVIGDGYHEIKYEKEYLGTYGINWLHCFKHNTLVASYNAQYVAFIEWEGNPVIERLLRERDGELYFYQQQGKEDK